VPVVEAHTISWLPATLYIRMPALLPEKGHNFELHTTIRHVLEDCERVSLWGPYRIEPDLYCKALRQIELLESGQVLYKANDAGFPSNRVSNCIHAVSSTVTGYRVRVLSPGWGETASYTILRRFSPWIIDLEHTHDWVAQSLGLNAYPIIYRNVEHPRSGYLRGPVSRMLGRDRDATSTFGRP
jgi:hypothetical protein